MFLGGLGTDGGGCGKEAVFLSSSLSSLPCDEGSLPQQPPGLGEITYVGRLKQEFIKFLIIGMFLSALVHKAENTFPLPLGVSPG